MPIFFIRLLLTLILNVYFIQLVQAQTPLSYYLPQNINYNSNISTPQEVLGYNIGDWHISHDQIIWYMKTLADESDRFTIEEYARSHENRPLFILAISSPANIKQLNDIQAQHIALTQPQATQKLSTKDMPLIVYQGFSIHGNESSGANAAILLAYYLAAAQGDAIDQLLAETVILLDPCFNPDGLNRFASWVNTHKSKNLVADPNSREHNEAWPSGRTNHYWFDLNRDWLLVQHPESKGRIRLFHDWKPNILTDHHEMGTNSTFFFQPGEPSRVYPGTPSQNQVLTQAIANFHADALDNIGSLYYSRERFDDFYIGKGSTYPDINACVGILFEQASSRGHLQTSIHGPLSFPFTIRNQFTTALSTLTAAQNLRVDLLNYQRNFYIDAANEASRSSQKAYIFTKAKDKNTLYHFIDLLNTHDITVYPTKNNISTNGQLFPAETSFVVPLQQTQYRLIKAIFEKQTTFNDSLFYDVSSWTLPLAFNIRYAPLDKINVVADKQSIQTATFYDSYNTPTPPVANYAYLIPWGNYHTPKLVYQLLSKGLICKVAEVPFSINTAAGKQTFSAGTIMLPVQNQVDYNSKQLHGLVSDLTQNYQVPTASLNTGQALSGIDLGSPSFNALSLPKVLVLAGNGVRSYDAGEIWHLLDERMDMLATVTDIEDFNDVSLNGYNVIVLPDGNYSNIKESKVAEMKRWLQQGNTLVCMNYAARWASSQGLSAVKLKKKEINKSAIIRPYGTASRNYGAQVIGGAIFDTRIDTTHPICYGYEEKELPVFKRGTLFMEATKNSYASPVVYKQNPLISGYVSSSNKQMLGGTPAVVVNGIGTGTVVNFNINPNFRAFWYGTNKLFLNALFFGNVINRSTKERIAPKSEAQKAKEAASDEHGHQH